MKPARHFRVVGGKDGGTPPNQSCIDHLEEALDLAKRGVLQSVILAGLTDKNVGVTGWSECDSIFTMLGILTQCKTDYQNRELEQYEPKNRSK